MFGGGGEGRFGPINRGFRDLFLSLGGSDNETGIEGVVQVDPAHLHLVGIASDVSKLLPAPGRPTRNELITVPASAGNHAVVTFTPTTRELSVEYLDALGGAVSYFAYIELLDPTSTDPIASGRVVVPPANIRSIYAQPTTFEVAYGYEPIGNYPNDGLSPGAMRFQPHSLTAVGIGAEVGAHFALPRVPVGHRLVVAYASFNAIFYCQFRIAEAVGVAPVL